MQDADMQDKNRRSHFDHLVDLSKGEINRSIFVDPHLYQRERKTIFAKCSLLLGHESQLPKAHDYITAYMGQDPVIVSRGGDGRIRAFLNMCRHRGNRVCRADSGNARAFTCSFHGWTFGNDGRLTNVPGYKEVYLEKLDLEVHGLIPVSRVASYKGLLFGCFDAQAPSLEDYLGDMAWYLDMVLDRRDGGVVFLPGVHKWQIKCNWKYPVDNFIDDSYHGPVTHKSAWSTGFEGMPRRKTGYGYEGFQISPGGGHGFGARWAENREQIFEMALPEFLAYEQERAPETEARLGTLRGKHLSPMHASIFLNLSMLWQSGSIRVWHPRSPTLTEAWSWCFVDAKASPEHRNLVRIHDLQRHGTSGTWEQDDVDNWVQSTNAAQGYVGRQVMQNLAMGLGDGADGRSFHPELRGRIGKFQSEINQRAFYAEWARRMSDNAAPHIPNSNA